MKIHTFLKGFLFSLVLVVSSATAYAQTTTGNITGSVTDSSNAALPNVEVAATNNETNFSRSATTDSAGQYNIQYLPPGTYRVQATASGFKKYLREGVVVELSRNVRVDPVLEVGVVTETVTVTSDNTSLVETTSPALGQVVNNQDILNLPLVDRDVYSLLDLTAGVDSNNKTNVFGMPGQEVTVNGSSNAGAGSVNYYLDGGNNTSGLRNTGNSVPNPDAVQEFRVITNSYSAEYGRFAGAIVDVVTKSGSNKWHGSLFEFIRNDALNANRWPAPGSAIVQKPPLKRNQFGGSFSGPLIKNKTFFFVSYSGLRQRQVDFSNNAIVPSALERTGDFSQSLNSGGQLILIRDPLKNAPCNTTNRTGCFTDNKIPANRLSPVAQGILKDWVPLPNLLRNGFEAQAPHPTDSDELQLKFDHALSESQQLTGAYYFNKGATLEALRGDLPYVSRSFNWKQQNFNVSHTWTMSSTTINQIRLSYIRNFGGRLNTPPNTLADYGSTFQVQGPPTLPQITVANYFQLGVAIGGPVAGSNLYQGRDVLSMVKGNHSIKLGGEISLEKEIQDTNLNNYGVFAFANSTARANNALADFLLGIPNTINQDSPVVKFDNSWYMALFVQDDYKIHPRLTLNLGLRYDYQLPWTDPFDRKTVYIPGRQSTVVPKSLPGILYPGDEGVPRGIIATDRNNIGPRVGLAWDPWGDGKTAIRSAFGVFYGTTSGNQSNVTTDGPPFTVRQRLTPGGTLTNPYLGYPGGLSPFPYVFNPADPRFILPASFTSYAPEFRMPYVYQMNAAVQRQLTHDTGITVAYVGSLGHRLPFQRDLNYPGLSPDNTAASVLARRPISPNLFQNIVRQESTLNTAYHALQITGEKRLSRGFSLKGFYTLGKGLEDAGLQSDQRGSVQDQRNIKADRARSSNDRRHNFVFSGIWTPTYFRESNWFARTFVDGWTLSFIAKLRSGAPLTINSNGDRNGDGSGGDRADLVAGVSPVLDPDRPRSQVVAQWFNTAAFANAVLGQNGTSGRNILDGPGSKIVDLGLFRAFQIGEKLNLQFRAEATNAFNMVNLSNPNTTVGNANFGRITSAREMRQISLGLRLSF